MIKYGLILALVAALGLGGALALEVGLRKDAEAISERLSARVATCEARIRNIVEDKESDNAVDNLDDDDLRHVPDHWLHPGPR